MTDSWTVISPYRATRVDDPGRIVCGLAECRSYEPPGFCSFPGRWPAANIEVHPSLTISNRHILYRVYWSTYLNQGSGSSGLFRAPLHRRGIWLNSPAKVLGEISSNVESRIPARGCHVALLNSESGLSLQAAMTATKPTW